MGAIALSPTNIVNNQLTYDKDNTYISMSKYEESPEIMIKRGDVIFVKTGSTVGKVAYVDKMICKTTLNPQVVVLKDIKCDNYILSVIMSTRNFQNKIQRITVGGAVPTLSQVAMGNILISLPAAKEQEKISKFISLLDERITTQNKIIEKLQSLIKGITILLTTKGEPNTTIAQCLECHSSTLQESEVSHSGLYKVFGANGLVGYTDMPQMNGDAILIIKDGSGVGTTSYAQGEFSVIGTLNFLTAISNYDLRYLYFVLSVFNFQSYKTGMAIPHIYFKDYGNAKIYCPLLSEQKRIANVLGKLESKLCFEQNILASFNLQKRYLLGQMFI